MRWLNLSYTIKKKMKKLLLSLAILSGFISHAKYVDMEKAATSFTLEETKNLQSLPGAPNIVYLNVTGYYVWKNDPEHIAQVVRLWRDAAENLRAFNVNVTTRKQDWDNTPKSKALFMNFNIHYSGGSCVLGMFGQGESVGGQNCHSAAQFYAFSHEIGHGLGIRHHWAPYDNVVGDGIKYTNILVSKRDGGAYFSQWSKGMTKNEENSPGSYQDDIQIMANLLRFRPADHGSTVGTATELVLNDEAVNKRTNNGVISQDGEVDMFKFSTNGGPIDLTIKPLKWYNNLHLKADIVDIEGTVVMEGNPIFHYDYSTWPAVDAALQDADEMNDFVKQGSEFKGDLDAGNYFIRITNSGYLDVWGNGYTSYSSLGYYELEGTIASSFVSVGDDLSDIDLEIFPNPSTDFINIRTEVEFTEVKIFAVSGKQIANFNNSTRINVSELAAGKYFLKLINNESVVASKRIIIK